MALRLTQAADYAIRSMIYIGSMPEGRTVLRSEVAASQEIPPSFMAKILRSLVRAGLLRSTRGVHGGFTLARPAEEINLLQVVEAIEGPINVANCAASSDGCRHSANCPAAGVWIRVQDAIKGILSEASLETLVSMPRRNGRVEFGQRSTAVAQELPCEHWL